MNQRYMINSSFSLRKRLEERVEKNYTRNEWGRCKTTLQTSGEVVKLHSKRTEKLSYQISKAKDASQKMKLSQHNSDSNTTSNEFRSCSPPETSVYFCSPPKTSVLF